MDVAEFHEKLGVTPDADGWYVPSKPEGELPIPQAEYEEAIRVNIARGHECLTPRHIDFRTFVYVGAGTTMPAFLDDIAARADDPDNYLVTCSNKTAAYLLKNGIIPHIHWIIDPKASKSSDFETTHELTEYWLNLGSHPTVFDTVEAQNRRIRVFLAASSSEDLETVKQGMKERGISKLMMLGGGSTAGVRAITLADALGFRKLEYYGFDGALDGNRAYAYAKRRVEPILDVEAEDGRRFVSTPAFSGQYQQFCLWSSRLPWIDVKMHGDSFIQHMWKISQEKQRYEPVRFTEKYAALQRKFHTDCSSYGKSGKMVRVLRSLAKQLPGASFLDYGCGKQGLQAEIPEIIVDGYDPFIPGVDAEPAPHDVVICSDVMEHVEPGCTEAVLDHIRHLTQKIVVFSIAVGPAIKTLPDGSNAHINQRPHAWWWGQIKKRWHIAEARESDTHLLVVAQNLEEVERRLRAKHY